MDNNENATVFGKGEISGIKNNEELQNQKDFEAMSGQCEGTIQGYHTGYSTPREYLHNFLLQAQSAGANVERYIDDEIRQMLTELKR